MSPNFDCPWCADPFGDPWALARHMLLWHQGAAVGPHTFCPGAGTYIEGNGIPQWIDCWCGESHLGLSRWVDHLLLEGIHAHFLLYLLGDPPSRTDPRRRRPGAS